MRVLGIDPSSRATGYGILEEKNGDAAVVAFGTVKPAAKAALADKLLDIKTGIAGLIAAHRPDEVAVENPFLAKNTKTAIILGQVRGAILIAVAEASLPLFEYSPLEIKKAVTGYGQAEKGQVATMIQTLLGIQDAALEEDASDALACALCHVHTRLFRKRLEESSL